MMTLSFHGKAWDDVCSISTFRYLKFDLSCHGLIFRSFHVSNFIKGERVAQDFNILKEAGGSKRALVKTFEANITNMAMDIHLMWTGKGTCCIPVQSTYGPLISAVHVSQGS